MKVRTKPVEQKIVDAIQVKKQMALSMETTGRVMQLQPGDWLIALPEGGLMQLPDADIRRDYEPMEGEAWPEPPKAKKKQRRKVGMRSPMTGLGTAPMVGLGTATVSRSAGQND